ncbi:PREDICTED: uncharacterized protein LOC109224282 [Nicotiana attenuata]|uniref:uncharacterized protein LOC109224282 n=1 Tax=Nicotiana attenuata TaxID=49451 RepID=UPI00090484F5|nr:PREDICTED: uncharacterized protein LOC109224282 [Nicotiana attenuata]
MTLLIPGPKYPGNDIDVYLQPMIEELKELWDGVETYDAYSKSNFKMRAAIMWTINDFPAYGNLSGWSTKGKLACPCCHKDTKSVSLRNKLCYMSHRRFLPIDHPWRRNRRKFDRKVENGVAPNPLTGDEALIQLQGLGNISYGKGKKQKRNFPKDNIISTVMNMVGKTKDTLKSRYDLVDLGIRQELHPIEDGDNILLPAACYALSSEEKLKLCNFLANLKVPDAFLSNISRCVNVLEKKIYGLKSHDHHVLLQDILPVAIRGLLPKAVCEPIIELGKFFKNVCSKSLTIEGLDILEAECACTLCKLEIIFPPAFFDVMVHLPIHLAREAKLGGPAQFRWMYPFERYLRTQNSYVRNNARPEGSIAEGYLATESLTFCSRYIKNISTKFNKPARNDDGSVSNGEMSIFKKSGQTKGGSEGIRLSHDEFKQAWNTGKRLKDRRDGHNNEFLDWFHARIFILSTQGRANDELISLAVGPAPMDIYELSYVGNRKIYLFKCHWWDVAHLGRGYKINKYGFTSVNTHCALNTNETFVLASQSEQVFYLEDMVDKDWLIVVKKNPRDLFNIPEVDDNSVEVEDEALLNEEAYQQEEVDLNILQSNDQENDVDVALHRDDVQPQSIDASIQAQTSMHEEENDFIDNNHIDVSDDEESEEDLLGDGEDTDDDFED